MLAMVLAANNSGNRTSGSEGYSPRLSGPSFQPYQGFNIGGALSGFGPGAGAFAMPAMMLGQSFAPDLMSRLQANANVNPVQLQNQRVMLGSFMGLQANNAQGMATAMGITDPTMISTMSAMYPFLSQMPGVRDFMGALNPTQMTQEGAMRMMNVAAIQDPMGRIRPGQPQLYNDVMMSKVMMTNGKRDAVFTSGMGVDDFTMAMEFAADNGMASTDMDVVALRQQQRERIRKKDFGGRGDSDLSADELQRLGGSSQTAAEAERLTSGASNAASVNRVVRSAFGLDTQGAFNFMSQNMLTPNGSEETKALTEAIRQIEALGNAAKISGEQLGNAARAFQAQSGTDILFASTVAATSAGISHYLETDAAANQLNPNDMMTMAATRKVSDAMSMTSHGAQNRAMLAIFEGGTTAEKAQLKAATLAAAQGDATALSSMTHDVIFGQNPESSHLRALMNMSADNFVALQRDFTTSMMTGPNGEQKALMNYQLAIAQMGIQSFMDTTGKNDSRFAALRNANPDQRINIIKALNEATSLTDIQGSLSKQGMSTSLDDLRSLKGALDSGGPFATMLEGMALAVGDQGRQQPNILQASARSLQANTFALEWMKSGAGQLTVSDFTGGRIGSFDDLLKGFGIAQSPELKAQFDSWSAEDQRSLLNAANDRANAMRTLLSDASPEEKKLAKVTLNQAEVALAGAGINDVDKAVQGQLNPGAAGGGTPGAAAAAVMAAKNDVSTQEKATASEATLATTDSRSPAEQNADMASAGADAADLLNRKYATVYGPYHPNQGSRGARSKLAAGTDVFTDKSSQGGETYGPPGPNEFSDASANSWDNLTDLADKINRHLIDPLKSRLMGSKGVLGPGDGGHFSASGSFTMTPEERAQAAAGTNISAADNAEINGINTGRRIVRSAGKAAIGGALSALPSANTAVNPDTAKPVSEVHGTLDIKMTINDKPVDKSNATVSAHNPSGWQLFFDGIGLGGKMGSHT